MQQLVRIVEPEVNEVVLGRDTVLAEVIPNERLRVEQKLGSIVVNVVHN